MCAASRGERKIYLDVELDTDALQAGEQRQSLSRWLQDACDALQVNANLRGVVYEVRQGYKSKGSKRQQADLICQP